MNKMVQGERGVHSVDVDIGKFQSGYMVQCRSRSRAAYGQPMPGLE